jgi:hypothetical protein
MKRLLMIFVLAAPCLWASAFTVNEPQPLTQFEVNEYNVGIGESIKAVGTIKNLSDEDLLETVQRQTFRYFWHYAHPNSGMARERSTTVKADFYWDFINEAYDVVQQGMWCVAGMDGGARVALGTRRPLYGLPTRERQLLRLHEPSNATQV